MLRSIDDPWFGEEIFLGLNFWTEEEFAKHAKISIDQVHELIEAGLPVLGLADRTVRISEAAADKWAKQRMQRVRDEGILASVASDLNRIANHFDPPPPDVVDSVYVAQKLGCTTTWVADMARNGSIPASCLVPGTGKGKLWKFYRAKIEKWLQDRR